MLERSIDNEGDDEPNTLKQVMRHFNWPKRKVSMQIEYNSLLENKT